MYKKAASSKQSTGSKAIRRGGFASEVFGSRNSSNERLSEAKPHGKKKAPQKKSVEVTKLEAMMQALEEGLDDPAGRQDCFCMASKHALSRYSPLCPHCGLILCELHSPAAPCPFCHSPVLSPIERSAVVARLVAEKDDVLRKEEEAREHERLEAIRLQEIAAGGGAFPTLSTSNPGSGASTPQGRHTPAPEAKVLSLGSRGHAIITTLHRPIPTPPPQHRPAPKVATAEELAEKERLKPVPPPSTEVDFVKGVLPSSERPWADLRGGGATYIPPDPVAAPSQATTSAGKKSRKKQRAKENSKVPGWQPPTHS